jgi:Icc-related predicted phosphoesterase
MNILAVADIHGAVSQVRALLAREEQFDLILIAGDLTHCGSAADAEAVVAPLLAAGKPLFAVPGNMDPPEAARYLEDAGISLHGRSRLAAGFGFMGAGGSGTSPFGTPFELSDGETESLLGTGWTGIAASPRKILLSHAPPARTALDRGFLGKHIGSPAIRRFLETHALDLAVCGHVHESPGQDVVGGVRCVNAGPLRQGHYCLIELTEAHIKVTGRKL